MTAVERFARRDAKDDSSARQRLYSDLIPLEKPAPGEQYAFEVDLDRCTGCKACVTGCHGLNGLDEEETWRGVTLMLGGSPRLPVVQPVTASCHHCLEPSCMTGCPVMAYEKDPKTGIVFHLDDQCIGCQYCLFMCPYDVPQFLPKRGIVRKCDMCRTRLAVGEAPACVQSCPTSAIRIRSIKAETVRQENQAKGFLPGSAAPHHTQPTTRYRTSWSLPDNMRQAEHQVLRPGQPHLPLVLMLVMTQFSVGALAALWLINGLLTGAAAGIVPWATTMAVGIGLAGLAASIAHLGRPLVAFRVILGLKTSWLSREVVALGAFGGAGVLASLAAWAPDKVPTGGIAIMPVSLLLGVLGIYCSARVYQITPRVLFGRLTNLRFFATATILGLGLVPMALAVALVALGEVGQVARGVGAWACLILPLLVVFKLIQEASILNPTAGNPNRDPRARALVRGPLKGAWTLRVILGIMGSILPLVGLVLFPQEDSSPAVSVILAISCGAGLAALVMGELIERYLFFTACLPPRTARESA
ncbi:MAG: dimethyl sulfoxide reductase anchor subunit [Deltaproteobacteria bacterium]|nr:dimethyl sulfoxide reductase anchor subunit [Deltaproteobacteria bacterium]